MSKRVKKKEYKISAMLTDEQKIYIEGALELISLDSNFKNTVLKLEEIETTKEQPQEEKEWPQDGDTCYAISGSGVIRYTTWSSITLSCLQVAEMGNCFRTREEAEFERDRLKVLAKMKKFAEPEDREWDGKKHHWAIRFDMKDKSLYCIYITDHKSNDIYFESKKKLDKCIKEVGEDEIRKYYLRIKE